MRISAQTRFPHPVLSEETQDYTDGKFSVGLHVSESRTTGKVTIGIPESFPGKEKASVVTPDEVEW